MALIDELLAPLIDGVAYPLLAGQSLVLKRRTGVTLDTDTLGESGTPTVASQTLACTGPWPYRAMGETVEHGMLRTSISGRDANLTFDPEPGHHAELDGRTYLVVEAHHDLDGDEWLLVLKGAG